MARSSKYTPQVKVAIVFLGLKKPGSISELCRKYIINLNTNSRSKRNFLNGCVKRYLCLDAYSRYIPSLMVSLDRTKDSTPRYYEKLFELQRPITLHTDNGTEFTNRDALAYLKLKEIGWQSGPCKNPKAQGLVERLVKTHEVEQLMSKEREDIIEIQASLEEVREWYKGLRDHSIPKCRVPEEVNYART